jgi:sugar lactone lactonase YvrE
MKNSRFILCALPLLSLATALTAQEAFQSERLEKLWQTPPVMKTPESALYDVARKVVYVSNMAGTSGAKDGQGFIAKLSATGEVLALPWVGGLNAPKGLGLRGSRLFVSGIDEIVEIDVERGAVVQRYPVEKAKDLNDVTIASDGTVYVSDTKERYIFMLKDGKTSVFVDSDQIARANGIFVDGDRLLVGAKSRLLAVDRNTRAITVLFEQTGYIDGLETMGDGRILASDSRGKVQIFETGKPPLKLLDTTPLKMGAADTSWVASEKIILVPTFADNRVFAYRLRD